MASGQVTAEDQMENTDADHVMEEDKKVKAPRRFDFLTYIIIPATAVYYDLVSIPFHY